MEECPGWSWSLVSLPPLSEGQLYLSPGPRRRPSSGHWTQVQLTALGPGCHHPFFWATLGKPKLSPKLRSWSRKRQNSSFRAQVWLAMSKAISLWPVCPLGKGVAGKPGRTGLAQMVLLSTTVIQVIWTKSGKLLLPDSPSSGYGTLGTSVRQDGTWQSQDPHLKLWSLLFLQHHLAGALGSWLHSYSGARNILRPSVSWELWTVLSPLSFYPMAYPGIFSKQGCG